MIFEKFYEKKLIKYSLIIVFLIVAIYLHLIFYVGFALIVKPPFGVSESETLQNMKDFCFTNGILNLLYSFIAAFIVFFISRKFIFKNFKASLILSIIFLLIIILGNFRGINNYYFGLQEEFKYHNFQK